MTTTTNTSPIVPFPAGAHRVEDWEGGSRYFEDAPNPGADHHP